MGKVCRKNALRFMCLAGFFAIGTPFVMSEMVWAEELPWAKKSSPPTKLAKKLTSCERISAPYKKAYATYNSRANIYWEKVGKKRALRRKKRRKKQKILHKDYVLTHPPAYKGPSRPKCLDLKKGPVKPRPKLPVVADFLRAAKRIYGFKPRPTNERGYKKSYALEALTVGLTADQVVGVYALETGGIGPYFRQSGVFPVDQNCRPIKPKGRAASTALGYAQLLAANSSSILVQEGKNFAKRFEFQALMARGPRKNELKAKAQMLRKMVRDVKRGVLRYKKRNNWREYVALGKTSLGYAVHALNLDADIGPLLQIYKLKNIIDAARKKGFNSVSGAELELMNLVGYGRGLEMMTRVARGVPTSNFFSRGGYYRNPVAKNLTANGLLQKIARIIVKRRKNCGAIEFTKIFREVSTR